MMRIVPNSKLFRIPTNSRKQMSEINLYDMNK